MSTLSTMTNRMSALAAWTEEASPAPSEAAPEHVEQVRFETACVPGTSVPIVLGLRCPHCSSYQVRRSHSRNMVERWRKRLTLKRPFRCDACSWRGWRQMIDADVYHAFPPTSPYPTLETLDRALERRAPRRMAS